MSDIILKNAEAEQYICAARKNFKTENTVSESESKTLICHFSDIHGDIERFSNVLEVVEYYKPLFAVHTGDLVIWDMRNDWEFFCNMTKNSEIPFYNCIGNHDTFQGIEVIKNKVLDERLIKPLKNINGTGEGYYYVDFDAEKLRLIVINDYENDEVTDFRDTSYALLETQCRWVIETLKGASEKGFGVIIAAHESDEPITPGSNKIGFCQRFEPYPWGLPKERPHILADIVDAFKNGGKLQKEYVWEQYNKIVKIDCEFSGKSEFICYLNGHRHGDYIGYLQSYPDQLSMGITCAGCKPPEYHNIGEEVSDLPRIPGTVSEDAVNFYVLDREKRTVTAIRVGAKINDLFEERKVAVYKY